MSREKIVAGNWKMNKTLNEGLELVTAIQSFDKLRMTDDIIKIVFPTYPILFPLAATLGLANHFYVGAQNCSEHASGAYTGEVSAAILNSIGCKYVLVGHSERREYFKESKEQLISKLKLALDNNLKPIFCFGEKLAERKNKLHFEIVAKQLKEVLSSFSDEQMKNIILAYEPVWAIGTGETATPEQAQEMHQHVRQTVKELFNTDVALQMPILYGGSCNAQNAKELFSCPDVDGGLIGGASLKAEDFCKIIGSF